MYFTTMVIRIGLIGLVLIWSLFGINSLENISHIVNEFDSVMLKGCHKSGEERSWKFAGSLLYHNGILHGVKYKHSLSLFKNNSLLITNVTLDYEGTYECILSETVKIIHQLDVQVIPTLQITIKGRVHRHVTYVEEGNPIEAVCHAIRGKPAPRLNWVVNGSLNNVSVTVYNESHTTYNKTFASTSMTLYHPQSYNGTITCISSQGNDVTEQNVTEEYFIYTNPITSLLINGKDSDERGEIVVNKDIVCSCRVGRARPAVNISWRVNDVPVEEVYGDINETLTETKNSFYHNLTSTIIFRSSKLQGEVSCIVSGYTVQSLTRTYWTVTDKPESIVTTEEGITTRQMIYIPIFKEYWIPLCGSFAVISYITVIILCYLKRKQACPMYRECSYDFEPNLITTTLQNPEVTIIKHPSGIQLPEIPLSASPYYYKYGRDRGQEDTYSTILDTQQKGKIFYPKDMCLISNLNMGKICNRWLGTISSPGPAKCVVATTLSDGFMQREGINWYRYVRRVLDLPTNNGVVVVEGVCVDNDKLYLLHKHLFCTTLHDRLQTPSYAVMSSSEVMRCISSILDGMELIHSYGFLHPGLSTRKILLPSCGYCKLYDFCLSKDVSQVVSEIIPSISQQDFPPESISRKEYGQSSDVWCVAIVLWKILSSGRSPFTCDADGDSGYGIIMIEPPAKLPDTYKDLRNDILLKCLNIASGLRPTMKDLRSSYRKTFPANLPASDEGNDTASEYVPMKALV